MLEHLQEGIPSKSAQKIEAKNSNYWILPKIIGSEKKARLPTVPKILSQNKFKRWHIIIRWAQIFFIYLTEDLQTLPALADFW